MGGLTRLFILLLAGASLFLSESLKTLRRSKRRWVLTTIVLEEGDPGPFPKFAGELFNDRSVNMTIKYLISGPGVDEFPEPGLFSVDDADGKVYVHRTIDREKTPLFVVRFDVADRASGRIVDKSLIFNVEVKDKNDNAPKFQHDVVNITLKETFNFENPVIQLHAYDNDKEDTPNSEVIYSFVSQSPSTSDMTFTVDPKNGLIRGKGCLNYEAAKKIQIIVKASDKGSPVLSSSATVNIFVEDGNNHMPVIIDQKYEGAILEGKTNQSITRIRVEDKDTPKTPAWRAKFKILSGNEKGNFNITTDPETNEGILAVIKPLDFEGIAQKKLQISVENEEPFASCEKGSARRADSNPASAVSINVNILDANDAPHFNPGKLIIREKEGLKPGTVLARCNATDPDVVPNKIRYKVAYDPEGWVTVDENTGVVTSVKELDRESPFLNNSVYSILIHAVDDGEPPQTGTGTIMLHVADINDNTPYLLSPYMEVCDQLKNPELMIHAADNDEDPFAGPFTFEMSDETRNAKDTWRLGNTNDGSAELRILKNLPKGNHTVGLNIYDRQGHSATQNLVIRICSCPDGRVCEKMAPAAHFLGGGSIAVMLAALMLFLLALLLLTCLLCGSSQKSGGLPPFDDGNQTLIKYNEEGGSSLTQASPSVLSSAAKVGNGPDIYIKNRNAVGTSPMSGIKGPEKTEMWTAQAAVGMSSLGTSRQSKSDKWTARSSTGMPSPRQPQKENLYEISNGRYGTRLQKQNAPKDAFVEQVGEMVTKRLYGLRDYEDDLIAYKPRIYAYEGELERIESVDSFTFPDDMDSNFLDHLGPKFAALGDICRN
ncbi:cadherin-like protein 26 [Lissotriton helveticus]